MRVLERYRQICLHPVFYLPALPLNADGYGSTEHKCKRVGKSDHKLSAKPELEQEVYRYISLISFSKEVKT